MQYPLHGRFAQFCALLCFCLAFSSWAAEKELDSQVSFVGNGPVVPYQGSPSLPINSTNVEAVDLELLQVKEPEKFLQTHYRSQLRSYRLSRLKRDYQAVYLDRFDIPNAKHNQAVMTRLPLSNKLNPGWYIAVLKESGAYDNFQIRHVLLTDLGAHARLYSDRLLVSVAKLSTGQHVSQGKLKLYGKDGLKEMAYLKRDGTAEFKAQVKPEDVLLIESGDQMTILPFAEVPLDLSAMDVSGRAYQEMEAFVYSNRDLIKPGETLPAHILLRDADGELLPEQPIHLSLVNPKKDVVQTLELPASAPGYYQREFAIASDAPVGRWLLEVRTDPTAKKPIQQFAFQVEEFVPERMDLEMTAELSQLKQYDDHLLKLKGRYLFGAPADGHQIKASATYRQVHHLNGPHKDYFVGSKFRLKRHYEDLAGEPLDKQGEGELELPYPMQTLQSPVSASLNVQLLESGGAAVQRNFNYQVVHGDSWAGLKPIDLPFRYYSTAQFEVARLSGDGHQLLDGRIKVELQHDQGRYYWVYEEGSGWRRRSQDRWKSVATQTVRADSDEAQSVQFSLRWGSYRVIATDLSSGTETIYPFRASWRSGGIGSTPAKPNHLQLTLDKASYDNGDVAKLSLNAPVAGDLLLLVEADGVLYKERKAVTQGKHDIEIPIEEGWKRHDLYLSAVLTGNRQDGHPQRYLGVEHLKLAREQRKLTIELELPEKAEPLKTLTVPVTVANHQGETIWLTLSMVDMGIINLSRYQPEDPNQFFFGQRRYGSDVVDLYSRLYDLRPDPFAISRFGGDGMASANKNAEQLVESKTLILMSQAVQLDENGQGQIEFELPDYNGSVQVVATAFSANRFGQSHAQMPVAAPLIAELSIPRFAAPGDRSALTVEIHNQSGQQQELQVSLELSDQLQLLEPESLPGKLSLDDGEKFSVLLPYQVDEAVGNSQALFLLKVASQIQPELTFDRGWHMPLRAPLPLQTHRERVLLEANETWQASPEQWQGLRTIPGQEGKLRVSSLPQIQFEEQAKWLFGYPYGCAEQTTSKARPFLLDAPELADLKQKALDGKSVDDALASAVARLSGMQKYNGGFGLWNSRSSESPWLSVYVTDFLVQTKARSSNLVPEQMLNPALKRIKTYVSEPSKLESLTGSVRARMATFAYGSYLLAQQGELAWSDLAEFEKQHDQLDWPTQLSQAQIAAAYYHLGDSKRGWRHLKATTELVRGSGYFNDYGSGVRDQAATLQVVWELLESNLLANRRGMPLLHELFTDLNDELIHRRWFSTQERYHLVNASLLQQQLTQGQELEFSLNQTPYQIKDKFLALANETTEITNTGKQPLHLELLAQGYPEKITAADSTLAYKEVARRYWTPKGMLFNPKKPVKVGERILVEVAVELSEPVPNAMLVEYIPAGFVLENPNLKQGIDIQSIRLNKFTIDNTFQLTFDKGESVKQLMTRPEHASYRNDRFVVGHSLRSGYQYRFFYLLRAEVPGTYKVPPLYLEDMYRPDRRVLIASPLTKLEVVAESD